MLPAPGFGLTALRSRLCCLGWEMSGPRSTPRMAAAAAVEAGATLAGGVERGAGSRIAIVEEVDEHSPRVVHCSPVGECESKEADEPTHTTACPDGAASAASAGLAGAAGEEGGGDAFAFTHVASWQPSCLKDKDTRALLAKWGMGDSLVAAKFSFSRRLRLPQREGRAEARKAQLGAFLRDALNDATVKRAVPLGGTSSTGATLAAGVTEVVFSELAVTKTSMSFFDRLEAEGIVHGPMWATGTTGDDHEEDAGAGGTIKKQFDVVVDGVTCQDELRDALANPDTEHVGVRAAQPQPALSKAAVCPRPRGPGRRASRPTRLCFPPCATCSRTRSSSTKRRRKPSCCSESSGSSSSVAPCVSGRTTCAPTWLSRSPPTETSCPWPSTPTPASWS